VASGTHETEIDFNDFQGQHLPVLTFRGHASTIMSSALRHIAKTTPEVAFVFGHPGVVMTNAVFGLSGVFGTIAKAVFWLIQWFVAVPLEESGARHLFESTSEGFSSPEGAKGVPLVEGSHLQSGSDGKPGSGVYSVGWNLEGPGAKIIGLLDRYSKDGTEDKNWKRLTDDIDAVLGQK
jgi:hypothetical protein